MNGINIWMGLIEWPICMEGVGTKYNVLLQMCNITMLFETEQQGGKEENEETKKFMMSSSTWV